MKNAQERVPARVSIRGNAVTVSDAGPADEVLLRNASDVVQYARHTIADTAATTHELRFAARCLADSLSDVLSIAQDAVDTGADDA